MPNRNQLRVLSDSDAAAIVALRNGLAVCEITKIYWPAPTGPIAYAFWYPLDDPIYAASNLETWLDGAPLVPAFVAEDVEGVERFHEIPRTAELGDDVVRFKFANRGREFEELAANNTGARVEIYLFYPQVNGGKAINRFTGHLRTPDAVDADYVEISAAEGLRSADLLIPNRVHGADCTSAAQFNGRYPAGLPGNPCDYDIHFGGTRGNLNPDTGLPYTDCDGTKPACLARLGDLESRSAFDAITDTNTIGSGKNTTVSTTEGQATRMKDPVQVVYGEVYMNNLPLLDFAKEENPKDKHADKGTIRLLLEVSEGPIEEISEVEAMDRQLPRDDGLGLEIRLGEQRQPPTTYSANVSNHNRLAHIRADVNPIDPRGVQAVQMVAKCRARGRNTLRIYSDPDTFTEGYSRLRAWALLDLMTDTVYGHREDVARHYLPDFIHIADKGITFDQVVQAKSAQQLITDICLAGRLLTPIIHDGLTRWLALEEYDLEADDIPLITDAGAGRNVLVWPLDSAKPGVSRLEARQKDDDVIPNEYIVTFEDAAHEGIEHPFTFPDPAQQKRAGEKYGDGSLRKVPGQAAAYGVTNAAEVRELGWYLLDYGPFYSGGIQNNGEVTLVMPLLNNPVALDMHVHKVFEMVSDKLELITDPNGDVFTHWIVRELTSTTRGELIVKAQAYKAITPRPEPETQCVPEVLEWTDAVGWNVTPLNGGLGALFPPYGDFLGEYTTLRVRSVQTMTQDGEHIDFQVNPNGAELYLGVTETRDDAGTAQTGPDRVEFNKPDWHFKINRNAGTFDCIEPDGTVIFSSGALDGTLAIRRTGVREVTFAKYSGSSLNDLVSSTADHDLGPLYGCVVGGAVGSGNQPPSVVASSICRLSDSGSYTGGGRETQQLADSAFVLIDRLWREQELAAHVPGVYVAAAPTSRARTWTDFELWRDKGAGYERLLESDAEATLGAALSVLAGTNTGSETVDVELQPGQALASYTSDQVTAGAGKVWLGGEIFQYRTATQLDVEPNQWRLSVLSNRGAHCTTAAMATHAVGDDFVVLDAARVPFVQLEVSEIGQTRNYKGLTGGQALADRPALNYTLEAPNFAVTTPADYAVSFDPIRLELAHDWTPLSDACLITTGLIYEVWNDASGSPGALLWSGTPNQWRQAFNTAGTFTFYLRARTAFVTGAFVAVTITVSFDTGTFAVEDLTGEFAVEDTSGEFAVEDE